ncbi:hypothetical protein HYC85_012737 [Camellia sinensis]|uniref:Uncharacterized protein n=1 Tax=Camellia sinensis TaxID=4442 RepID=A0A7J7HFM9_CAMSI|nr:hypothetical protein HYC85_012737 [Camellia sinensis]
MPPLISTHNLDQVRDELEQLLDDDDDMANLYLSRKLVGASSLVSGLGVVNWCPASPTTSSKKSRASRASVATFRGDENDVEELEMLIEAITLTYFNFDNINEGIWPKFSASHRVAIICDSWAALDRIWLREYIDDTEDYITIQLDNHRNQLIQVVLVTVAFCTCIFMLIISYARYKGLLGS